MHRRDLKNLQPGDVVEYQQPLSTTPSRGTFQRWHSIDDGQTRLLVRSQPLGMDLSIDPGRVLTFTRSREANL
jgi:hypothetical protein